jgi:hypothetical protein
MSDYYESAEDIKITRSRALSELTEHGVLPCEFDSFFAECGSLEVYSAQKVLRWLGY